MDLQFIATNLRALQNELTSSKVTLVAVSKTYPNEYIYQAFKLGLRDFGENKALEMQAKHIELPKDINWHFIGHLQSNKVKYIVSFVHLIHSVDSEKLLQSIDKEAKKVNRIVDVLLQIYIAKEESKFGMDENEIIQIINNLDSYSNINIRGLMGMATNTENEDTIKSEFSTLKSLFHLLKQEFIPAKSDFNILSFGMSNDFKIALECGSTMIRIGSKIFGSR